MKSILETHLETGKFDHGYLLAGDFENSRQLALEATRKILQPGGKLESHPDFFYQKHDLFGIEEGRDLIKKASQRPFGERKVFLIELFSFSIESANALLKTLEEPYPGTYFFILVPSLENVLPTLASRLTVVDDSRVKKELSEEKIKFYKKFLKDLPVKRLETAKKFIESRQDAIEFLNELELATKDFKILEEIQRSRNFLFSQGASAKMVLEHVALALPRG